MDIYGYQTECDRLFSKYEKIEKSEYEDIKFAYENFLKFIWFEEKFRVLLDNFYEFEKDLQDLYNQCLDHSQREKQIDIGQHGINLLNRRLLNFTSSAKLYIDELDYDSNGIFKNSKNSTLEASIKKFKSEKYDNNVSYQLMEMLRNILQHKGLLIRSITLIKPFFEGIIITPIFANIRYSDLKKNSNFTNKIKNSSQLDQYQNDDLNVVFHLREYVKDLYTIHEYYRSLIAEDIKFRLQTIESTLNKIQEIKPNFMEIAFFRTNENLSEHEGILVDKSYIEKYKLIKSKNILSFEEYFLNKNTRPFRMPQGIPGEIIDIVFNMIY